MFVVDVFDAGRLPKAGELQETIQPAILTLGDFAIEHQAEALLKGKRLKFRLFELFRESGSHPAQAEVAELVKSLIKQHGVCLLFVFALVLVFVPVAVVAVGLWKSRAALGVTFPQIHSQLGTHRW